MTRRQDIPQVFYGNYSLHNRYYQYTMQAPRDLSPQDPQALEIARGSGVSIVNIRTGARTIEMEGGITGVPDPDSEQVDFQERLEFLKFFMQKQQRWLRVVPEDTKSSKLIFNPINSTASITAIDDATNISIKEDHPQWEDYRISFDADVSSDSDDQAGISFTFPAVDLSTELGTGAGSYLMPQFDFLGVKVPDESEITEIEVRIGSDSSNYYSKTVDANYEGRPLEQGLNLLSVPFWENTKWTGSSTSDDFQRSTENVTETGTVNKSSFTYGAVIFKYSDSTPDLVDFGVDAIILTDDFRVRNFPCTLSGSLSVSNPWEETVVGTLDFTLLNYEAYSRSTHSIQLIDETGITSISQDFTINLEGNTDQLPTHTIVFNSTTNLDEFKITNLRNNQVFSFTDENVEAWATNDTLTFDGLTKKATRNGEPQLITGRIPSFNVGRSSIRYEVVTSASDSTAQNQTTNSTLSSTTSQRQYGAQSFLTPIGGTITEVALKGQAGGGFASDPLGAEIRTNSGSSPSNTILGSLTFDRQEGDWAYYRGNIAVANATTYWIYKAIQGSDFGVPSDWDFQNSSVYANGTKATSPSPFGPWTSQTHDFGFIVTIEPTPSTDFDVSVNSPILYN